MGRKDSYGNYDLYMAQLTPNGWEDTYHFGSRINTDQWESQPLPYHRMARIFIFPVAGQVVMAELIFM